MNSLVQICRMTVYDVFLSWLSNISTTLVFIDKTHALVFEDHESERSEIEEAINISKQRGKYILNEEFEAAATRAFLKN